MNVIVIRITGNQALVLTEHGEFMKIAARRGMLPGCQFRYEKPALKPAYRKLAVLAASVLVLLCGAWAMYSASNYADISTNLGMQPYLSTALHGQGDKLFIERAEASVGSSIRVVFSRDVPYTGAERVELIDGQGVVIEGTVIRHDGDEWTVQCASLAANQDYRLSVTGVDQSAELEAPLVLPGSSHKDSNGRQDNNADDQPSDSNEIGRPTPRPSPTADVKSGSDYGKDPGDDENDGEDRENPASHPIKTKKPEKTKPNETANDEDEDNKHRQVPEVTASPAPHDTDRDDEDGYTHRSGSDGEDHAD